MMKKGFTPLERKRNSKDNCSSLTGFTLLELVVVIIILGVLATLGLTQYGSMVEKSRGAEAKIMLGEIRKLGYGYWLQNGNMLGMDQASVNIGTGPEQYPSAAGSCSPTSYWQFEIQQCFDDYLTVLAWRCAQGGKDPQGLNGLRLIGLKTNFRTGVDIWWESDVGQRNP